MRRGLGEERGKKKVLKGWKRGMEGSKREGVWERTG